MPSRFALGTLCTLSVLSNLAHAGGELCRMQSPEGLIAHEWGTFTSFSGSDGKLMYFSTSISENLPAFVSTRSKQTKDAKPEDVVRDVKTGYSTLQRMETPVIYFYAPKPMSVDVRVDFPSGLITEFYPPVSSFSPPLGKELDTGPKNGSLEWRNVRILGHDAKVDLPKIETASHYAAARDASEARAIQFSHHGEMHTERFLFYRGLGDFELPIRAEALGNDHFRFSTTPKASWPCVFLVSAQGGQVRWVVKDQLSGSHEFVLTNGTSDKDKGVERLVAELRKAGLFEIEARAMVNTWKDLWFAENGTRFLAIMPSPDVDSTLPLKIEPKPVETNRVFVARLEILTPELERQIENVVSTGDAAPNEIWKRLRTNFAWMGRFLSPAVDRVKDSTQNLAVRERLTAK